MTIRIISSSLEEVESAVASDELDKPKSKPTMSMASKGVLRMIGTPSLVGKTFRKESMEFISQSIFEREQGVFHRPFLG